MSGSPKKSLSEEIARLESVLNDDPASMEFYRLADAYTRAGRFADAARVCELGLNHHPDLSTGYVSLGRALFGAGRLTDATEILRKALDLDSAHAESFRLLGEVLIRRQQDEAAVALLEEAIKVGISDAKIKSLLQRARNSLAQEATQVTKLPPDGARGIGNRAVAGSIGSPKTEDFEIEVTKRVRSDPPPMVLTAADKEKTQAIPERAIRPPAPRLKIEDLDEVTTVARTDSGSLELDDVPVEEPLDDVPSTPELDARKTQIQPRDGPDWHSIGDRWERKLDAGLDGEGLHSDSDLRGPFMRRGELGGLAMSPLEDPLADGIPPLPPDVTDEVELPEAQQTTALELDEADTNERSEEDQEQGEGQQEEEEQEEPSYRPLPGALPFDTEEAEVAARLADVVREEELTTTERSVVSDEAFSGLESVDEPPPASHTKRRSRMRWVLPLMTVLVIGGLVGGWLYLEQVKATKELQLRSRGARSVGALHALQTAIADLKKAKRSKQIRGELDLLAALAYLVYGAGDAEETVRGEGWPATGARAARALAANRIDEANRLLEAAPEDRGDRAMHHLLRAWSAWLDGSSDEAYAQIDASLGVDAKLALALLLRGHVQREQGDYAEAEQSYGKALTASPGLHFARLGQAAALMRSKNAELGRIEAMINSPVVGKVAESWVRILRSELALRDGEKNASKIKTLVKSVSEAPVVPVSLYGVGALASVCDFDGARELLERLGAVRSDKAPVLRFQAAQLAFSEGRELEAAKQLQQASSKRARELRGLALLIAGRVDEARQTIGSGEGPLQLLVAALTNPKASIDQLRKSAASKGGVGRLALTLALLQRRRWSEAERSAAVLSQERRWSARAWVLAAEAQQKARKSRAALATLERLGRVCPGYLPGRELLGSTLVGLGRYGEGAQLLVEVRDRGRRTAALLAVLSVAHLELKKKKLAAVTQSELERIAPKSAEAKLVEGYAALASNKPAAAAAALEQAGDGMLALVGRGRALTALPKRRSAAEQVLLMASKRATDHPLPKLFLGELYATLPNVNKALTQFRSVVALGKKRPVAPWVIARAHIGIAREGGDRNGTAIAYLKRAIKADPSNARAHRLLGEEYYDAENGKSATSALRKSLELDPNDATAWYYLGLAAGRKEAREACKRFLKLEPKGRRAREISRRLARLR